MASSSKAVWSELRYGTRTFYHALSHACVHTYQRPCFALDAFFSLFRWWWWCHVGSGGSGAGGEDEELWQSRSEDSFGTRQTATGDEMEQRKKQNACVCLSVSKCVCVLRVKCRVELNNRERRRWRKQMKKTNRKLSDEDGAGAYSRSLARQTNCKIRCLHDSDSSSSTRRWHGRRDRNCKLCRKREDYD